MAPGVSKGVSPLRVLAVTGGLCLAGGVVGAVVGAALFGIFGLVTRGINGLWFPEGYAVAALLGGFLGGVLIPLSAWTFLRRVPFGRVFGVTTLGTAAGCVLGLFASGLNPFVGLYGAIGGYAAAVAYLFGSSRREFAASLRPRTERVIGPES